jgi:hypothetical protein
MAIFFLKLIEEQEQVILFGVMRVFGVSVRNNTIVKAHLHW